MYNKLSHFDKDGKANMVDVSGKNDTIREAKAFGKIKVSSEIIDFIKNGEIGKGDVLGVARVAGIMASKKTSELIPMCHLLLISSSKIDFNIDEESKCIEVTATVKTDGKTGVEMEALTSVSTALLTIYDMCKAVDKRMVIEGIHLLEKAGGKSGDFKF